MGHQWDAAECQFTPLRAKVLGGCSTHNACLLVWDDQLVELEPHRDRDRALATIASEPFRRPNGKSNEILQRLSLDSSVPPPLH